KLAGNEIPLLARIAGLVDSYDAMITPRPYASTQSSYRAIQELIAQQGKLFQASLVDQFVQAVGMFPAGSLVKLNTGEVAIVTRQNRARRLRPELVVVLDENKQKLSSLKPLDLGDENVNGDNAKWIVCELAPGSYGITSEEYFI
ncbi:MAG: HD-GYP domain-containing protein, partial [Cellvibrionaceae bacterium]|nr:HD-GYP domain-containing protein [Cellvibrionaceae bacterium]